MMARLAAATVPYGLALNQHASAAGGLRTELQTRTKLLHTHLSTFPKLNMLRLVTFCVKAMTLNSIAGFTFSCPHATHIMP